MKNINTERIKDRLRGTVEEAIGRYLDSVDIMDLIDEEMIQERVNDKLDYYVSDIMTDTVLDLVDEIVDETIEGVF